MKRILMFLCAVALVLGMVASASALNFNLTSIEVDLNDSDPGLVLYWNQLLSTPISFELEEGNSTEYVPLFELGTNETWVNLPDRLRDPLEDTAWKPIGVTFTFFSPSVTESSTGRTRGVYFTQQGIVRWDGPAEFSFDGTGQFNIYLTDEEFCVPGSAIIQARLDYRSAGSTAPVPEPSTMLLLGVGLLGLVCYGRKRFGQKN